MGPPKSTRPSRSKFNEWDRIGNVKTMLICNVTSKGSSLAVVIPKDSVDVHGIVSGDRIRVWFLDHYRKKHEDE